MKINIIPCIGKFYSFVVMITKSLDKVFNILGIIMSKCNVALNTFLLLDLFNN